MTSQPGEQTIVTHIAQYLENLIDYNMRIVFVKKWYTKCGGETSPKPFSEKLKLSISLDQ